MLSAEPAILVHFKSVSVVFLVFHCVVVALLAFCASECNFYSHNGTSRFTELFFSRLRGENASLITAHDTLYKKHILNAFRKHNTAYCATALIRLFLDIKKPCRGSSIIPQPLHKVKHFLISN